GPLGPPAPPWRWARTGCTLVDVQIVRLPPYSNYYPRVRQALRSATKAHRTERQGWHDGACDGRRARALGRPAAPVRRRAGAGTQPSPASDPAAVARAGLVLRGGGPARWAA